MAIFLLCYLFVGNGNYELLLLMIFVLLLCFCWMHFWRCGMVCVTTLMELKRNIRTELYGAMVKGFNMFSTKEEISSLVNHF